MVEGLPVIFCCLLINSRGCSTALTICGGDEGFTMQVTWPEEGWGSNFSSSELGDTDPAGSDPLAWSLSFACCSASWCLRTKIFGILDYQILHKRSQVFKLISLNTTRYVLSRSQFFNSTVKVIQINECCSSFLTRQSAGDQNNAGA